MTVTTNEHRTVPSSGVAGRSCVLAALILSVALLATGCLAPFGAATQGDLADLRKAQDDNFRDIKFTLSQISATMETQRQANGNDVQTTLDQLAHIRQDLNTLTGGTRPVAPVRAVVTPVAPVAPTPTPYAAPPVRTAATPSPEANTFISPSEPATATPQADSPGSQEEQLTSAKNEYARRNYDRAIEIYSAFLKNNPTAPGAPTATYYMASSYYGKPDFEKALAGYKSVLDNYPGTEIAPQTLLAQALCEKQLNRTAEARATLLKLQSTYPSYDPDKVAGMLR